jgi:hypothetical protein
MSSPSVMATAEPAASTPEGGPASTSSTPVVTAVGPADSTPPPMGPTIDVCNSGGGRSQTYRQHP